MVSFMSDVASTNHLPRIIDPLPETVFRQFLSHCSMVQGMSFRIEKTKVEAKIKRGVFLICPIESTARLEEITKLILNNYPQGIAGVHYCPTKILENIASSTPEGIFNYNTG